MTPEAVDGLIAQALDNVLDRGAQPLRVLLSMASYRALVERDGLAPRRLGAHAATSLRAHVMGFDLPVDCERSVADDDACVTYVLAATAKV